MAFVPFSFPFGYYLSQYMYPSQILMTAYPPYYSGTYPYGGFQSGQMQYVGPQSGQIYVPLAAGR